MTEETFAQRIERLVQEHNRPLLLALEPFVSALFILQHLTALQHITTPESEQGDQQPSPDHWDKEFPITSVTRADLVSGGVSQEQASLLSDADMRADRSQNGGYVLRRWVLGRCDRCAGVRPGAEGGASSASSVPTAGVVERWMPRCRR